MNPRRARSLLGGFLLGGLVLAACGGDDGESATTSGPATSAPGDGAPTGDGTGDPTGSPDDGTPATATGDSSGSEGPASTGSDDGGGTPCSSNDDCDAAEICEFADHSCGVSGASGTCTARPADCPADERPVCGCDGQLHASRCSAAQSGVDVDFLGECELPNGAFACGFSFCIHGEEYCLEQGGTMPSSQCIVLPPVCQPPDCSCITTCCGCDNASCCSDYCTNQDDALTYTCPG